MAVTPEQVLEALRVVHDPDLHRDIVSLGFVQQLAIDGPRVRFDIVLTTPACPVKGELHDQAKAAVFALPGVEDVDIHMTFNVASSRRGQTEKLIPLVRNVVAVASGKGGVGKSTVSTNLAVALASTGARVGLFDADVYGPNIPLMMGFRDKPELYGTEENKMLPLIRYGVKLISVGFLISDDDIPVIWRGPMVHGVINQFLRDVDWGELDYLVVDLPPGTGDAPLSLTQLVPVAGVVIVTTPQDVALQDVMKGVAMFEKLDVPIVGVIENMSYFACPHCGEVTEIFGSGGGERVSRKYHIPLLGRIPLDPGIRAAGDRGQPVALAAPTGSVGAAFVATAEQTAARLSILALEREETEKPTNTVPIQLFSKPPTKN